LSMLLENAPGRTAWSDAVALARRSANGRPVLLAGAGTRAVSVDSLARVAPDAGQSRVLPAVQSAAEAGAERVLLITDGALGDAPELARWLPALGITLDVRNVARALPANRAISEVSAPDWAEAGKPLSLRVGVSASGAPRAGGQLIVRQDGIEVARAPVPPLAGSGVATASLTFEAKGPAQGGLVRYDVAFDTRDSIPDDDVRSSYVFISDKPAGVAIVSFDPDWEPRFLHPVLADALGLPVRTFLRVPNGMYFRGGNGAEAGTRVDEPAVQRAVAEADLLVLHGMSAAAPQWAQQAAARARHLIVMPADQGMITPIATSAAEPGDWYVSPEVPPSPIAALLAGIDIAGLPPLSALGTIGAQADGFAPLLAGRTPRGGRSPVLFARSDGARRWAVALGEGYWRWAFRGGSARDAYARVWGALAGWIVQDEARVAGAAIRPIERAVARGTPIRWLAPGLAADSLVLTLSNAQGRSTRTAVAAQQGDTATTAPPPPGHYRYDVRAFAAGREIARANGPLTVESYSPEFIRRPVDLGALRSTGSALSREARARGRSLHTYTWLYLLLAGTLAAEWLLRRRWGLR
ncbi:MAG TPA: hypothetical protein VF021_08430, partial [Longimicrobiales bacterium]